VPDAWGASWAPSWGTSWTRSAPAPVSVGFLPPRHQGNYFFKFDNQFAANADPVIGPLLSTPGAVLVNVRDIIAAQYLSGWWCFIVQTAPLNPQLATHPNLEFILDREALTEGDTAIVVNNLAPGLIGNLEITTETTGCLYASNGSIK
jgi:hypothetical protein